MQAAPPLSGSGTQTDPYLITSKADVLALAKYVNGTDDGTTATNNQTKAGGDVCAGLYFAFTADVDMQHDTTFLGIGAVTNFHRTSTTSWKFSGNIDGRGHKISNLTINGMVFKDDGSISTSSNTTTRGSRQYTGFIGILEKGSVTNLHFDASCSVTSYSKVGMVVGRMSQGSTVSGCSSAGTVRSYSDYAGGIVGDCSATSSTTLTVADCQNTGTVYCNYRYAGGITGGLYYGTITNCINTGRIELHSFHSSRAEGVQEGGGGIMGYWQAGGVITNCFNGGVVSVSNQYAGGITGRSSSSSKVQLCGNVALGYVDCPSMNNRGAVAGNLYSPSIVPENNYYDTSLWGTMAAGFKEAQGITGLTTQQLTGGTLPAGLDPTFWQAEQGLYVRPKLQPALTLAAAQTYILFPEGTSAQEFGTEASISTQGTITATVKNEEGSNVFSISGGKILCGDAKKVSSAVVTLVNGSYTLQVPLTKIPVLFSGSGTEADPYIIATAVDLQNMASMCNGSTQEHYTGKYFSQTADIDMKNEPFEGIACVQTGTNYPERTYWFAGIYNGNNHTISNVKIDRVKFDDKGVALSYTAANGSAENVGLFGALGAGARIKNVRIVNGMVRGYNYVGSIAGYTGNDVQITDCYNGADITCLGGTVGGIVGRSNPDNNGVDNFVERCVNTGNVLSNSDEAGGIIGYCIARLTDCVNTGAVTARHFNDGINSTFAEVQNTGGIAGTNQGDMTRCANFGSVYCDGNESGGLTGFTSTGHKAGNIVSCYNAGAVGAADMTLCGALIGDNFQLSSNPAMQDCAYDSQFAGCRAANNQDVTWGIPLTTAEFVNGEAWLGATGWTYRAGYYPINTALADEPAVMAACASYIVMPEGQTAKDFRNGTLSTAMQLTATSSNTGAVTISGNNVSANTASTAICSSTVTLTANGFSRPLALQFMPYVLSGTGTEADPFVVASAADFNKIGTYMKEGATNFIGKYFVQNADIDFASTPFVQAGADGNWFGGSYDGRNHSVSNITSQAEATTEVNSHGLFGGVAQGGIVKNLSLKGFNLQANLNGGLLAGTVNGTVSNITTDATSRIAGVKSTVLFTTCKGEHMGGIAGLVNPAGRIENCTNRATVEGLKYAGGIAGYSATTGNPVITGCVNYGTVTGTAPQEYTQTGTSQPTPKPIEVYAGGIAGQLSGTATNCVNHGLVTMSSNNNAVGGIAGSTYSATTIDGCVNYGEVTARNYSAGGIVGETANTTSLKANMIQNCRNYGVISGINRIAGIAGYVKAYNTLKNCANFADLEPKGMRNGGIAGEVSATVSGSDPYAMFENCYNTGAISCNGYVAGIAGYLSTAGTHFSGCFNAGHITAANSSGGAAGITNSYSGATTVLNCYNEGTISGKCYVAGLAGNAKAVTATNCYNDGAIDFSGSDSYRAQYAGNVIGEMATGSGAPTVQNCYYTQAQFDLDDKLTDAKAISDRALMTAALGTGFVKNANCKPMVAGLDTVSAAKAYAAYFTLSPNDNFKSVNHSFPLGMLEGVVWSATGNLRISDGRCYPAGQGTATLTATCGAFSRTYEFDCKTGISVLDADNDPVVSMRHYLPDGTEVTNPEPGTLIITVSTTASGRRNTTRHIAR